MWIYLSSFVTAAKAINTGIHMGAHINNSGPGKSHHNFQFFNICIVVFKWIVFRAVTSTDFRNRLTVPPNWNRIRLTKRFAPPYGALCFHMFTGSDSPPGPSRLSLQVVSLLVSNQTSLMQIKRQSKIITCGVFMHKNKSLT